MHEKQRARLVAYSVAVLAPAVTLLVRWPLDAVLGDRVMYMAFFPAVLLAAYFGGFWPGLLATALSALAAPASRRRPRSGTVPGPPPADALARG